MNQIFDIRNGKLVYSYLCDSDLALYLTVDGERSRWHRIYDVNRGFYLKQLAEDVDEDTANPKIIRLKPKDI